MMNNLAFAAAKARLLTINNIKNHIFGSFFMNKFFFEKC